MDVWWSWSYHYLVGGLVFGAGVSLAVRAQALRLQIPRHRRLLVMLVSGLTLFLMGHAAWIILAS